MSEDDGTLAYGAEYQEPPLDTESIVAHHVQQIIDHLGYDRDNQHFRMTPFRAAKVLLSFKKDADPQVAHDLLDVSFTEAGATSSLVLEGPIRFNSMCAHHMLPVTGWAWVAYLPNTRVCGLSKLARVVHHFAHQFTVQERVTQQIADAIEEALKPLGTMVVIRAEHGCMKLRGVMEPLAETTTSAVRGIHKESASARNEFLALLRDPK
jgi:GTP cyclohydrolase I